MISLKIAVIGLGWFGEIHCETIAGIPELELAALATRRPDRLQAMSAKFDVRKSTTDYRKILADPSIDAVSIVTQWHQHVEPACAALESGKHVFLEKPMAMDLGECRRILETARSARGILQVGHICRFNPRYRMAKQAIEEGRIGRVVAMSSRRNIPLAWTHDIIRKIGPVVGDGVHDTDLMLWLTGDRIVSAYCQTVTVRGLENPDVGQTMYRFESGATATMETAMCMPEQTPFDIDERLAIIGTEGIIHVQDTFPNLAIVDARKLSSPDTTYWPMFDGVRGGALRDELAYFARTALDGRTPEIGRAEDAAAAVAATLAAERSSRTGTVESVEKVA